MQELLGGDITPPSLPTGLLEVDQGGLNKPILFQVGRMLALSLWNTINYRNKNKKLHKTHLRRYDIKLIQCILYRYSVYVFWICPPFEKATPFILAMVMVLLSIISNFPSKHITKVIQGKPYPDTLFFQYANGINVRSF